MLESGAFNFSITASSKPAVCEFSGSRISSSSSHRGSPAWAARVRPAISISPASSTRSAESLASRSSRDLRRAGDKFLFSCQAASKSRKSWSLSKLFIRQVRAHQIPCTCAELCVPGDVFDKLHWVLPSTPPRGIPPVRHQARHESNVGCGPVVWQYRQAAWPFVLFQADWMLSSFLAVWHRQCHDGIYP